MAKILVTGGCGYIGSHTIVDLIANGYDVISADNNSRSVPAVLDGVEKITRKKVKNYRIDLCNFDDLFAVFAENSDLTGIIHFAAYKSVEESVRNPLLYYENNLVSLINLLKCAQEFRIRNIVFSSSCTVYGAPDRIPVTEEAPLRPAASPYGHTKQVSEEMLQHWIRMNPANSILLRYFNPAGAHPSGYIGELPVGKPQNLVPAITQTAIGKLPRLTVHGTDYDTRDGSCIRDYIHICDLAQAHTLALRSLEQEEELHRSEVLNLGSGHGVSVLEAIAAFESASGLSLHWEKGPRRAGDVPAIFANNDRARQRIGWNPRYSLHDIMESAWKWEQRLRAEERVFGGNMPLN